jgi:hypothetical protein
MNKTDINFIKQEEATMNTSLKKNVVVSPSTDDIIDDEFASVQKALNTAKQAKKLKFEQAVEKRAQELLAKELKTPRPVNVQNVVKTDFVLPDKLKVFGIATLIKKIDELKEKFVKFPDLLKVTGRVKADVTFPTTQKVKGEVVAKVEFPKIQKVEVTNPKEIQKIQGDVKTDIPIVEVGTRKVIPMMLWDGKRFINPFATQIGGGGMVTAVIRELQTLMRTQAVGYSAQVRITVSGSAVSLRDNTNVKTVVLQALKDNRNTVYVSMGGTPTPDYELQPGQPVTVVIDNLNKVKVMGSYPNDGVCYVAT